VDASIMQDLYDIFDGCAPSPWFVSLPVCYVSVSTFPDLSVVITCELTVQWDNFTTLPPTAIYGVATGTKTIQTTCGWIDVAEELDGLELTLDWTFTGDGDGDDVNACDFDGATVTIAVP